MPSTPNLIDALRRLAVATLAYAVAVALVAAWLMPALLSTDPVSRLLPKAHTVVAWRPDAAYFPRMLL